MSASNSAGTGPLSQSVILTVNGIYKLCKILIAREMKRHFALTHFLIASNFFPEQVLESTGSSSETLGEMPEINQPLSISEAGPVVVDAIGRKVYWYSRSAGLVYSQSLTSGPQMVSHHPSFMSPP